LSRQVAGMAEIRNIGYKIFVEKLEEKIPLQTST
jgi:hypothetical protein